MNRIDQIEKEWLRTIILNQFGHNTASVYYTKRDRIWGLLSTVLTAVVSTAIFASLSESNDKSLLIVTGAISVVATAFATIHNYEKNGTRAEQHRNTALQYGVIRRSFELLLTEKINNSEEFKVKLEELNKARAECASNAPTLPNEIYNKAKRHAEEHEMMKIFEIDNQKTS